MILNVLSVIHRLNLKDQLVMKNIQYVVMYLWEDCGVPLLQFSTVVDFIQRITESRAIIVT